MNTSKSKDTLDDIQQELLKAREEGYKKGYIDGGIGVINERFKDI